ncbi:MAG: hypothetical protein SPI77_03155 [Corynebacterium sp.]|nr:hypothetical protein [Corynebacterium sp.]
MATNVYKTLAKIVGILLLIVGVVAIYTGSFAGGFVKDELTAQGITMPTEQAINAQTGKSIQQEDADILLKYAGSPMDTGAEAKAYAEHYVGAHMRNTAKQNDISAATFQAAGDKVTELTNALKEELTAQNPDKSEQEITALANAEIANKETTNETAKKVASLQKLRTDTFFMGSMIQGTLLNAYGWGLVGTIVTIVGWLLIVAGIIIALLGFVLGNKNRQA